MTTRISARSGTFEDWSLESLGVAQKVAYGALSTGETFNLGADYFRAAAPAADDSPRELDEALKHACCYLASPNCEK